LAGIKITGNGQPIRWDRDPVNMYEFHLTVPQGVSTLDVVAEFISPPESGGFSSGSSVTSQLAVLSWNQFLLYPKDVPSDKLEFQASLKVPTGWRYGTALPIQSETGNQILFKPSSLTTLVDSPVQAGANFKTIDLSPNGPVRHYLHIAADSERATRIRDEETKAFRNLVAEANTLFGANHFRDYHFLYTLSDHVAHFGLEHHESSDDRVDEDSLTDEDHRRLAAGLLPHEFVHSWNGKFRRPAGLATPSYNEPMEGALLWVYEGLTEYLGEILTPRSGLSNKEDFLASLALEAAALDGKIGRTWRPLADTAVAAAKANLDLAQVTFGRMQDLHAKKSISNQEFDEASAKLKAAEAAHDMARARRAQLNARLAQADQEVRATEVNRTYAEILAPFAGLVVARSVEPGILAIPGAPLLTIEREGSYRLEASVAESRLQEIRIGQAVSVNLDSPDRSLESRVSEIVPAVDATSRTYVVKIDLPAAPPSVRSGAFARAAFQLGSQSVLAIPAAAVAERGQLQTVFVDDNGTAHSRLVTTGQKLKDRIEVLSGLSAGEKLIYPVPPGLTDGAPVTASGAEVRP
jgi:RND family efflux transporter MFP subunit